MGGRSRSGGCEALRSRCSSGANDRGLASFGRGGCCLGGNLGGRGTGLGTGLGTGGRSRLHSGGVLIFALITAVFWSSIQTTGFGGLGHLITVIFPDVELVGALKAVGELGLEGARVAEVVGAGGHNHTTLES